MNSAVILNKHEDRVTLTRGQNGKLNIQIAVYEETIEKAIEKAFWAMKQATNKALSEGYVIE